MSTKPLTNSGNVFEELQKILLTEIPFDLADLIQKHGKINPCYCRKSSEDKKMQVQSIPTQLAINHTVSEQKGIPIHWDLKDVKTGTIPFIRPDFIILIKLIYMNAVGWIFTWKINRLARNPMEGGILTWLLQKEYVNGIVTPKKTFTPEESIEAIMGEIAKATEYSRELSENVSDGLLTKCRNGDYPCPAPIGYANDPHSLKGEKRILVDNDKFDKVRQLFDYALTGQYGIYDLVKKCRTELNLKTIKGKPMSKSTVHRTLHNPMYYGKFLYKGSLWDGRHTPIISEDEFNKIQFIFSSRDNPREHKHINKYNGMIKCGHCGHTFIPEPYKVKKQKNGVIRLYKYWRCSKKDKLEKCPEKCMREDELERQLTEFISSMRLCKSHINWLRKWAKFAYGVGNEQRKLEERNLTVQLDKVKSEIEELGDFIIKEMANPNPLLTREELQEKKNVLVKERDRIKKRLAELDENQLDLVDKTFKYMDFCINIADEFKNGNREKKREILFELGRTFTIKDGKLSITPDPMYWSFQLMQKEVASRKLEVEPLRNSIDEHSEAFSQLGVLWSRVRDEVRTHINVVRMQFAV